VREIALLLKETDVGEIEVSRGDLRIRVARTLAAPMMPAPTMVAMSAAAGPAMAAPAAVAAAPVTPAADPDDVANHPGTVRSPMVGTAYRKPSPEAKTFVEVGSTVKAGDKLMLIEAMKTFNDIVAPKDGTIASILVNDGQPVEYGQPLMVIA
jgi:acetyl-CoA carboxylase biotin carboxyl carrier protein